jgi:hypothetical protein
MLCTLLVVPLLNALRPTKGTVTYILQKIYEFRVINFWKNLDVCCGKDFSKNAFYM